MAFRRGLRQEEWPLEVDRHHFIVARFRYFKEIDALPRTIAGVVNQQVNPPEGRKRLGEEAFPVDGLRHVRLDEQRPAGRRPPPGGPSPARPRRCRGS